MGKTPLKYRRCLDDNVCGLAPGCQSSRSNIRLKHNAPALIIRILASVCTRQIPWPTLDYGRPPPNIFLGGGNQCMCVRLSVRVCGGRCGLVGRGRCRSSRSNIRMA